ncbi:MAG: RNA 2',3'-cyclic phosphodiesterase [Candidatus Krumholzibacteriota bacterium]|nr:RNA 2',3'-cyclic phosphodiesterase [Candidatus Krumholzibacteriota bacterium]
MRLFFGVNIIPRLTELVWRSIEQSPVLDSPWRWIPRSNYHITLKFLGETDDKILSDLKEASERAVSEIDSPFRIRFDDFGAFPSLSRPRVVFYSVREGKDRLSILAQVLNREMANFGFKAERRRYHAHLTLARVKKKLKPELIEKLKNIPPLPEEANQMVDSVVLFRSHLSRSGALYEKVCDFTL